MRPYDPTEGYFDPQPAPPPRARLRWPFLVGAACWFIALALVLALIARQLP